MRRLELDAILRSILGSTNVYYNPPANLQMKFPAIVYKIENAVSFHANNEPYFHRFSWLVTYITTNPDPDNTIVNALLNMKACSFRRSYISDGFYHFQFLIYY